MQNDAPQKNDLCARFTTSLGHMTFRLFPKLTPKTVENFSGLAQQGKYDGTIFHRIIEDFMIQWGDYENANGTGGKSIWGSEFEDEFHPDLKNIRWALSMANAGPGTNGSQFFIVHAPETSWLDGAHTVFGQLIDGEDVLDTLATVATNMLDQPEKPVVLESVEIFRW